MEAPLEIRYAGVTIGRAQEVRSAEGEVPSFFILMRDPMPVGTVLRMRSGDHETPVRVVRAVETTDAATCGMQVRTIGDAEEVALEFIPPPALVVETVVAKRVKPGTPTPVVEVDLASMAESPPPVATAPADSPASIPAPASDPTPVVEVAATTLAVETAVTAPAETVSGSSGKVAAVPEAIPMVVGSSVTGALRSATESVSVGQPASASPAESSGQATASPSSDSAETSQPGNGAVAEAAPEAGGSTAAYGEQATELPPARPIAGPSGRRKTRRRK
jgi:hypothetical protein